VDSEIIYSIVGIVIFIIIIVVVLRSDVNDPQKKEKLKKDDILNGYREELRKALEPLKDNKEAKVAKKSKILKKINSELAMNIFFDKDEIREVILKFSKDY